jgi:integrase
VERKDPRKGRDERILDQQIARGLARTVRQVNEEFYELRYGHAPRHTQRGARRYQKMINQAIGDMPIEKVTRKIFIEKTGFIKLWIEKQPTAKHLQVYGDLMFKHAIDQGYYTSANPLIWGRFKSSLPKKEHITKNQVPVPYQEMPEFMAKLLAFRWRGRFQHFKGSPPIALLLALVAYSGGRPGEARQAQWKEFDFENMTWTVPWQHLKTGRRYQTDKQVSISKPMYDLLMLAAQIAYPKTVRKLATTISGVRSSSMRAIPLTFRPRLSSFPTPKIKNTTRALLRASCESTLDGRTRRSSAPHMACAARCAIGCEPELTLETSCGRYSPTTTSADPTAPTSCSMNAVL